MIRGKRAELPLFDDALDIPDIPPLDLKGLENSDVVDFTIRIIAADEIVAQQKNPKYKNGDN